MSFLLQVPNYLLLAFGFGFVIFFHELGHFLAAKYCGVKVEQFALGFGPAFFAWRKGIGLRWGSSTDEYNRLIKAHVEAQATELPDSAEAAMVSPTQEYIAAKDLGLGETEYRLNWLPLGGYVKMLGQDDLRPGVTAEDERSYNNKPIRSRMLIVSAGVVMNVILAAIGYMVVYLLGYPCPPAVAGSISSNSPAVRAVNDKQQNVPLVEGDEILAYDGKSMHQDFSKLLTSIALSEDGDTSALRVRHRDGREETLYVKPLRADGSGSLFSIGLLSPVMSLQGPDQSRQAEFDKLKESEAGRVSPNSFAVVPGDTIIEINGQPVKPNEVWKLSDAMAESDGGPIELTIRSADGKIHHAAIPPHFQENFAREGLAFLGILPRARAQAISEGSPVAGKIMPDDVILSLSTSKGNDSERDPSVERLTKALTDAGSADIDVSISLANDANPQGHTIGPIKPDFNLGNHRRGLGVALSIEEMNTVVADVKPGSSANGLIQRHDRIIQIDGKPVSNWFQVRRAILNATAGKPLTFTVERVDAPKPIDVQVTPTQAEIDNVRGITFSHDFLSLRDVPNERKTHNPLVATWWGVVETRDLIQQFYVTLHRMGTGGVPRNAIMGPIGIAGAGATFASKGVSWLLWFLAMISANLAVVNFLPFPIVDGGLFAFLLLEKAQGKPLPQETQRIIQMVGLVLILGVFLFVTYGDIVRIAGI